MITATDLEVRAGARTLLSTEGAALRVQPGDRIGLVGRNGAGKTTTLRILAGEGEPYAGTIDPSVKSVTCHKIPAKAISRYWAATGCCRPADWIPCWRTWKSSRC